MPGLDGTGLLFAPLLEVMPPSLPRRVLSYPTDRVMGYDELLERISAELAGTERLILIAESFSGPLAVKYAAAKPDRVKAVILCASFVASPLPRRLRYLACPLAFHLPIPSVGIRMLLLGWNSPPTLVHAVKQAIARVPPAVLAHRIREVLSVDCCDSLARCSAPFLYLRADQDALVRPRSINRILSARSDITVRSVSGPHLLLQASPAAAWNEIMSFLRRGRPLLLLHHP
jgi:pimeloyl-[acyl-carrier protein] methyl ester esterase